LTRIESSAFSRSSLRSIIIPRHVQFIDGSAFQGVVMRSIEIGDGNPVLGMCGDLLWTFDRRNESFPE
jgi:hypothetical protein